QQLSMAATAGSIMAVAPLASALHGHKEAEVMLLITWAAAVFYARRFLKGNGGFTLFAFTEVLLASALPGNPSAQFLTAAVGFGTAYVLRFRLWPPDEAGAFRDALDVFFRRTDLLMQGVDDSKDHLEGVRAAVLFN